MRCVITNRGHEILRHRPLERNLANHHPQPPTQRHDRTGRILGHLHAHRAAGRGAGAGAALPRAAGRKHHQYGPDAGRADLGALPRHAGQPLVADGQRRRGDGPHAGRGALRRRNLLGRRGPLQPRQPKGRLHAHGLLARLSADQPAEDPLRPVRQRRGPRPASQGVRHRHAALERPLSGRRRSDGKGHQDERQLCWFEISRSFRSAARSRRWAGYSRERTGSGTRGTRRQTRPPRSRG